MAPSPVLNISFIALTAVMYSLLVIGVTFALNKTRANTRVPIYLLRFFFGGLLLVTGLAAIQGAFLDFSTMPPRIFLGIIPAFIFFMTFAFHPRVGAWLESIPQWWLIAAQSFRIVVEIQLYFLSLTPLLPKLMTFEGRNFDILVGLTAPAVAYLARKAWKQGKEKEIKKVIVGWNVASLVILTNVVVHGILSAPTPFRQIVVEPPNTALGHFPFVWLPMFLVPFAYMLHVLSLRKAAKA